MYGMYYAPIRIFRLYEEDPRWKQSLLRLWTLVCSVLYIAHVSYLSFWTWDYTYNMAANVAVGAVTNIMWVVYTYTRYQHGAHWSTWPTYIVTWIIFAMSMELFDFPPWYGMLDAHSLWHLGTVIPTIWWYK
jgi:hypothetical protein